MNNRQVVTAARWQAMQLGFPGFCLEAKVGLLFIAADNHRVSKGNYNPSSVESDCDRFEIYKETSPLPEYLVSYIREAFLVSPPPMLLLGYERKES
ncbi:MAG: hypothetical protein ACHQU0_01445 [Candidatus Paceibacteria bacterium]